ncbi:MAG: FAD:protein FMN transferase [Defluviitaleaceae bacterium]|nr:FAD:protein FMN transferase [Defluviitaleaceae bacterium]
MKKCKLGLGLSLVMLVGCGYLMNRPVGPHQRDAFLMRAPIRIQMFDLDCPHDDRCDLLDEAFDLIFDLERRWTVNDVGGEVEEINEMAGIRPVEVQDDTFYLISRAIDYSIYSDGLFNAAIGALTRLWDISFEGERRPTDSEIEAVLPLLDPTRVVLDAEVNTVFLEEVGMRLDLGAIAKGFMADLVAELFSAHEVERALLIIGGEVFAIGGRYDGTPWRIGIRNPWATTSADELVGTIPLLDQAAVTSGTYVRYFTHQETDQVYHHIFDAQTGFPFETDVVSLTIVADTGLLGEVYSTIVFAMGLEAGMTYVEAHHGLEALFITVDKEIYLSSGLQNSFDFNGYLTTDFEVRTQ